MSSRDAPSWVPPERPPFELTAVLDALYDMEINCGLQSFWDGGWTVWIGDEMNGRRAKFEVDEGELSKAAIWLAEAAIAVYPRGQFPWRLSQYTLWRPDHADPDKMREWLRLVPVAASTGNARNGSSQPDSGGPSDAR